MKYRPISTIIWDVDNTLWNWTEYAQHTYPAMSEEIASHAGLAREQVEACMRDYYGEAGTMESSWLVQGLEKRGLFDGCDIDPDELISRLQRRFHQNRTKSLQLYPGIEDVLETSSQRGVQNLILSDAPAFHAASRIRHLDVDEELFMHLYALEDSLIHEIPEAHHHRFQEGHYGIDMPVTRLAREKPDTDLEEILGMTRLEIQNKVMIIGDNPAKDMALASRYGALGILATWGQANPDHLETLKRFAPERTISRSTATGTAPLSDETIYPVQDPSDIPVLMGWRYA